MTCVIIDDEYLAIDALKDHASRLDQLEVEKTFINPEEALTYVTASPPDIIFLDIQMPYLSGFDLLKKIDNPPIIIFTTARHEFAVQAFEAAVLDYLVKPISFDRFKFAVQRAEEFLDYKKSQTLKSIDYLMIRADYRVHKILFEEINYLESFGEYVKIHTKQKTYVPHGALKDFVERLPAGNFVRIHKSYVVARDHIASHSKQSVILRDETELSIGRMYKDQFVQFINKK